VILLAAATLTVACGSDDKKSSTSSSTSAPAAATTAPPQSLNLTATEAGNAYGFDPTTFSVKTGAVTIHYLNKQGNSRPHTLEIRSSDGKSIVKSDEIDPGKTTDVSFTLVSGGQYTFLCYNPGHADRGQRGTFTAEAAAAAAAASTQAATESDSGGGFFSRHNITLISLLFHIPAITLWVGLAMFDIFALMTPGIPQDQRLNLIMRFKWFSIVLIVIIMITGIWQTLDNPFHRVDSFNTLEELRDNYTYGLALFIKHIFVIATFGTSLLVRFFLVERTQTAMVEGDGAAVAQQTKLLNYAAIFNLGMTLFAVLAAARMTIELH
jgi:uncharacterized cupredoxin-like copper-binding protein